MAATVYYGVVECCGHDLGVSGQILLGAVVVWALYIELSAKKGYFRFVGDLSESHGWPKQARTLLLRASAWVEQAIDVQSTASTDKYMTVGNRRYGEANGHIGTVPFALLFTVV